MRREDAGRKCGSVLILTLWTLLLLCVVAAALGTHVSTHLAVSWDLSNRSVCYYAAKAGIETAIAEVKQGTNGGAGSSLSWHDNPPAMKDIAVGGGVFTVFHVVRNGDGTVQTNYGVADENGKVNINEVTNAAVCELVKSLLRTAGGADEATAESIAVCMSDWIDSDDQPGENGAEKSHYTIQSPPYDCHNGRMDRAEELMLVKGMTAGIFAGIADRITVYGTNSGVNINTADPVVLRALARTRKDTQEADAEGFVRKILEFRAEGNILTNLDRRRVRTLIFGDAEMSSSARGQWAVMEWLLNHRLISVHSRYYCGISKGGMSGGGAAERQIAFVFDSENGEMKVWNEE